MKCKPLSYDSLKTVIRYMNPNLRFLLSSRAPSIRTAERAVPLKIDKLLIGKHAIRVDEFVYEFEVYQVDCEDKIPYKVSGDGELNFIWTCNVDKFGVRDYITRAGGMLPGNNGFNEKNLFGDYDLENIPTNEGRLQKLKRRLNVEKQRYNQLINYQPKDNLTNDKNSIFNFICIHHKVTRKYKKEELELLENEEMVKKAIEYTNEKIKDMENELLPFENKRKNIRPIFEIHLTKQQSNSKSCVIERVKYTGDLHKAGDSLMKFMFGKRQHAVQVNELWIYSKCQMLQLPFNLKMKIKHLNLMTNVSSISEIIKPIIEESSFPCEKLKIYSRLDERQKLDLEFIKHFKTLEIEGVTDLTLPFIQNLENQIVNIQVYTNLLLQSPDFINLIKNWVAINKPIGTCFTFYCYQDDSVLIQIINRARDQIEGAIAGDKCVNIPMRNSAVLKVSYEQIDFNILNKFLFTMAVMSSE
uniref:FTH domain-containing protein n=1 Tax=Caenorhabditis tropicalis TaxID=1561998 RepID=A0A1I7TAK3_9PELO